MDIEEQFPVELASNIVNMLNEVTNSNVNFMNREGVIIATKQPERLGTIHEGAKRIMSGEVDELAISLEAAEKLEGVLPGYNGAVLYKGERIGCIGLSGDPEKMRFLQKLAAIIIQEEFDKYLITKKKQDVLEKVSMEIGDMSAAIEQLTAGGIENFNQSKEIEGMASNAEKYIESINTVLSYIENIARQTKLLGLNARVEAARAGEQGRCFGVVALQIGELSAHSAKSLENIDHILSEIKRSITCIAQRIHVCTSIAEEQSAALQNMSDSVMKIQAETEKLVEEG